MNGRSFLAGFDAGLAGWNPAGPHSITSDRPPGSVPDGVEWFLGCNAALRKMDELFHGKEEPTPEPPESPRIPCGPSAKAFDGAAYIAANFNRA